MKRHINKFATRADIKTALSNEELFNPYVAYIEDEESIDWGIKLPKALMFTASAEQTLFFKVPTYHIPEFEYSYNGVNWNKWVFKKEYIGNIEYNIPVAGLEFSNTKPLFLRGNNYGFGISNRSGNFYFGNNTAMVTIAGELKDIFKESVYSGKIEDYKLKSLFEGCTALYNVSDLVLPPSEEIGVSAFSNMFYNCTNLEFAPYELPYKKLRNRCYFNMFYNTKVSECPKFPDAVELLDGYDVFSAFISPDNNISKFKFPEGVTEIELPNKKMKLLDFPATLQNLTMSFTWIKLYSINIVCRAIVPPTLGVGLTTGIEALYVPDESVDLYKAATNWSTVADKIRPLSEYTE